MKDLLTTYSLTDIIIFIVGLAMAYKGVISFFDWWKAKRKKDTLTEMKPEKLEQELQEEIKAREQQIQKIEVKREKDVVELRDLFNTLNKKVDLLINSDKDDIKAYITREYHYFVDRGWIDDYSMDCLEKRYSHYLEEDGNSFIGELMAQLRSLPRNNQKN